MTDSQSQVIFNNVHVWNGTDDDLQRDTKVLVSGNKIDQIGPDISAPEGATAVDGGGGVLIPGLIDMHSHLGFQNGLYEGRDDWDNMSMGAMTAHDLVGYLDQGFTTARDAGSAVLGIAKAVEQGRILGPRVFPSGGFLTQTGGHADFGSFTDGVGDTNHLERTGVAHVADGVPEVLKAARHNLRKGATQIKLMAGGGVSSDFDPIHVTQYSQAEIEAAVAAAEDWGTYAIVHAYHDRSVNRSIDAGVRCIEHGFLISEETVQRMAEEGVAWSFQGYMSYTVFAEPEKITFFSPDQRAKALMVREGTARVAKWAKKYGVHIVSGGDMFGEPFGQMQAENIIVEAELGFTPLEAMKHATSNAATVLGWSGETSPYREGALGVIEPGAYADLLVINGNPLEDLTVLRDYASNLKVVMLNGEFHKNLLPSGTGIPEFKRVVAKDGESHKNVL